MIFKRYRYRIYPTNVQAAQLAQHFGAVRYIYNWGLETKKRAWEESKERVSYATLQSQLPTLKKQFDWLKDPYSQSLQIALQNLDTAFINFFQHGKDYPTFKKRSNHQSLAFCQPQANPLVIDFEFNTVRIPKVGPVKCIISRPFTGRLKTVTIIKTPSGKYFASCLVETFDTIPEKPAPCESQAIGVDLGIKTFAVLSNGETIANPRFLNKSLKALRRADRQYAKKKKGSKNKAKCRLKRARIHERVANQRLDFLHKTSTRLIRENQAVCIEDLAVKNMEKNPKLARHIKDTGWGMFREMLTYKAEWYGKNLLIINRFAPSSRQCSCGVKNDTLKLSQRTWTCTTCGTTHDRDLLAAQNIKKFAFHPELAVKTLIGRGTPEFAPVETLAVAGR